MRLIVLLCLLLAARSVAAQTCTQGLGDPIVNITFGAGKNFGGPLTWVKGLTYQDSDCPNDGFYTLESHSDGCFGPTWYDIHHDHTGDPNGNFMLINASYQPSVFYTQTIDGLCGSTSYQFAAWVYNVGIRTDQIRPNITFTISQTDGTVLNTGTTGDIPGGIRDNWKQYAFYFTTPPGVNSVILKMNNNAPGGNGNDIAIDDITFRTAGSSVTLSSPGFASDSIQVCDYGQAGMVFNAVVENCYPSQQLQWQMSADSGGSWQDIAGQVNPSLSRAATAVGRFEYRLLVAQTGNIGNTSCEVASTPMVVDVVPLPAPAVTISASLSPICLGLPVSFVAAPVDEGKSPSYQWLVNGLPAGTDSSGFTTSSLVNGDAVKCVLTSDAFCVLQPVASSNILAEPVVPVPVTGVGIGASATAVCKNSLVRFSATAENGGDAPGYQWMVNGVAAGGNSAIFSSSLLDDGDVVNCVMTGSLTCSQPVSADPPIRMTVYPLPTILLDSVVIIAGGASVRLQPVVTGESRRSVWTPGLGLDDSLVLAPVATPRVTTTYQLYVETVNGCHALDSERVEVYYPLRMPGAFSPNGDGRNEIFRVPPVEPVTIRSLAVFNREGLRVYYTEDVGTGWDGRFDGRAQPAGTYVWELTFVNPVTNKVEERKGTVILIR